MNLWIIVLLGCQPVGLLLLELEALKRSGSVRDRKVSRQSERDRRKRGPSKRTNSGLYNRFHENV